MFTSSPIETLPSLMVLLFTNDIVPFKSCLSTELESCPCLNCLNHHLHHTENSQNRIGEPQYRVLADMYLDTRGVR